MAESGLKDNIQGSECVDDGKILNVSLALGWRFIFDHLKPKYRQEKIERSIVNTKLCQRLQQWFLPGQYVATESL